MKTPKRHPDSYRLYEVASEQGGYFTTSQAKRCGYTRALLFHHTKAGEFINLRYGLYRLKKYPDTPWEEVMAAWVAAGRDDAAISHETALALLELSDTIPNRIHITLPRHRRGFRAPHGVSVHTVTQPFEGGETLIRHGMRVTSPARSIVDAAEAGTAPEQILHAVKIGLHRGVVTQKRLKEAMNGKGPMVQALVQRALDLSP